MVGGRADGGWPLSMAWLEVSAGAGQVAQGVTVSLRGSDIRPM
jgi:hypothetical protein